MGYYIKQGQSSMFQYIKLIEEECQILKPIFNITKKKKEKVVQKIKRRGISQAVISREIKQDLEFVELLHNYDIVIFDGKWLMQYMLQEIIDYLKEKQKVENTDEITILANDLTNEVKQNIKRFANTYKKIRIVTNHLEKFKRVEEELFESNGIPIIISNNKRKVLAKSELIINFDFVQETINQYNIYENAVIINLDDKIKINKKRFSGIVITDYEVEIQNFDMESNLEFFNLQEILNKQIDYSLKEILEEKIYSDIGKVPNCNMFETIENAIKKYNIQIKELYGLNRSISLKIAHKLN